MSIVTRQMVGYLENSSWIRRMFEAGIQLKQQYGEDAVCDFSLGNPDLAPPRTVKTALQQFAEKADQPFSLGYMPNGGFPWARQQLAQHLSEEQGVELGEQQVILTCGAAGGLNALFKSILDPQDEVLAPAPCFVEYGFYVENHGGVFSTVPAQKDTFQLDLAAFEAAITPKTRAVIINSPNNPTGVIYPQKDLQALAGILAKASERNNRPIFLISDEPYRFLAYDNTSVPSVLPLYKYAVLASSFSKNLSLAGERLGYLAISPLMPDSEKLMAALIMSNRILGFVNPPVIGQHIMAAALGSQVDAGLYLKRRNLMAEILADAGYEFSMPTGAFYFFPKAPGNDDVAFVDKLLKENILAVPGSGFMGPGHFRLTFCVDEKVIARSAKGFARAIKG